ncbi:MAG: hypothetical protein Kow0054_09440 [Deferrisoma sp.]
MRRPGSGKAINPAAKEERFGAGGLLERRAWLLQWPDAALTHGRKQAPRRGGPPRLY